MECKFGESTSFPHQNTSWSSNNDSTNTDTGDFECNICFELAQCPIITLCGHLFEMESEFGESTSFPHQNPSWSSNNDSTNTDTGDFECNICFELAQDPIITLCGHLFCWPCLYRWLHHHSQCQDCPVCKAVVEEDKLVPLYGRGKVPSDPRLNRYPGVDVPSRPAGQRPQTAPPPPVANQFANYGFGFTGGFMPMATARIGNFTFGTAFGGLIPSLFNFQVHGFSDTTVYGTTSGYPYAAFNTFHGGHGHHAPQPASRGQSADNLLKNILLLAGFIVILAFLWG